MLPLVALVTIAGIISLGLAVVASWALLTILLLIMEAKAEAHRLKPRAVLRMDRKQPIPNAAPENSGAGSEGSCPRAMPLNGPPFGSAYGSDSQRQSVGSYSPLKSKTSVLVRT
jgi:hypothetical protein